MVGNVTILNKKAILNYLNDLYEREFGGVGSQCLRRRISVLVSDWHDSKGCLHPTFPTSSRLPIRFQQFLNATLICSYGICLCRKLYWVACNQTDLNSWWINSLVLGEDHVVRVKNQIQFSWKAGGWQKWRCAMSVYVKWSLGASKKPLSEAAVNLSQDSVSPLMASRLFLWNSK